MSGVNIAHRVHNAYEQLASGLLPPDLWSEEMELAVMVHLIMEFPLQVAVTYLRNAVEDYNRVNAALRLPQLDFHADRAEQRLALMAREIMKIPGPRHAATVYRSLLEEPQAAAA